MTPPDGMAVEQLAIAMAAAVGLSWTKLAHEDATRIRIMANAAIIYPTVTGRGLDGPGRLRGLLEEGAEAQRAAARELDHIKGSDIMIRRLHLGATAVETVGAVLGVMQRTEADDETEAV